MTTPELFFLPLTKQSLLFVYDKAHASDVIPRRPPSSITKIKPFGTHLSKYFTPFTSVFYNKVYKLHPDSLWPLGKSLLRAPLEHNQLSLYLLCGIVLVP